MEPLRAAEEGDPDSVTESTLSTVSSVSPAKSRSRRKGKTARKRQEQRDKEPLLVSCYDEYEEDHSRDGIGAPEQTDYFALKLRRLREIIALTKPKSKEKEKKKKSKKKKASITKMEEAEQSDLQEEKQKLIEELQAEIENETTVLEQKLKLEEEQMQLRRYQLKKTWYHVSARKNAFIDYVLKCSEEEEWFRYMTCDGLPDPSVLPELNTFLFLWSLEDSAASMKTLPRQCEIVIYLIKRMDEIILFSLQTSSNYASDYKLIRQKFRDKLENWIDMASYCLLRQIERDTMRIDLRNAKYVQQLAPLVCCFWAFIKLPISMKQVGEKDKKAVEVAFEEVGLTIKMPADLDCYCTAIRLLWLGYDHYSDLTASFDMPGLPEELRMNTELLDFCQREFDATREIREEQREERAKRLDEKRATVERILHPPASATAATSGGKAKKAKKSGSRAKDESQAEAKAAPLPYLPSPEEVVLTREDEIRKETRRQLFTRCKKTEINLRKYAILGGLYRVDLINQPPQPKDMQHEIFLTTLQLPKQLEFVKFWRPYKAPPPAPDSERTPEVIEAEMKALEAAMEALVLVTLKLPDAVMWFEPPLVAHWLPEERIWSTEDVHDIKYNEEKQTITFRTGRLGLHGLAVYRFVNLPFQSWELKPEKNGGGVILGLTGSIIQLEFLVRISSIFFVGDNNKFSNHNMEVVEEEDLISLHSIVGGGAAALQDLIDQFMKIDILILKMRAVGCDVFPEADAASYLKGIAPKHPTTVKHLQDCLGLLSTAYTFSWSRWNVTRGPREIVMQVKEIHGCIAKEKVTEIMLVTPLSTSIVRCFEVSPEFTSEPANEHDKFYADVYHYALHNAGIKTRLAIKSISFKLSTTVTRLLEATNVINMSA